MSDRVIVCSLTLPIHPRELELTLTVSLTCPPSLPGSAGRRCFPDGSTEPKRSAGCAGDEERKSSPPPTEAAPASDMKSAAVSVGFRSRLRSGDLPPVMSCGSGGALALLFRAVFASKLVPCALIHSN